MASVPAPTRRPAETAGVGGSIVTALALAFKLPVEVVAAAGIVAGAVPSLVTYLVANGGVRGVCRRVWSGR